MHYDAIIIGAGLAGCTLGTLLCRAGKRVLAIDKADLCTKDKLCGGLVTAKSYRLLGSIFGPATADLPWTAYDQAIIDTSAMQLTLDVTTVRTIPRKALDRFALSSFLESGGDILDQVAYDRIDPEHGLIEVAGFTIGFDHLIAADGALSSVRRNLTGRRQHVSLAVEALLAPSRQPLRIDCLNGLNGYAYVMPNEQSTAVGIGDCDGIQDLRPVLVAHFNLEPGTPIRGALLPCGNDVLLQREGAFFVGDAAGLISPITGEGIYSAMASARALAHALLGRGPAYSIAMAPLIAAMRTEFLLKRVIYNAEMRNRVFAHYGTNAMLTHVANAPLRYLLR